MGLFANLPVGLAPGLGLNAYVRAESPLSIAFHMVLIIAKKFTYSIVGFHGTGTVTYREALAAVFMEGYVPRPSLEQREKVFRAFPDRWIFVILSLLGLRQWLVRIMPQSLVFAVGAGIGLFIA